MGTMKVEIISRETIQPSSPTPPHLQNYTLSLLDRLSNRLYIRRVLFYTSNGYDSDPLINISNKYNHLKNSLSQILTKYYPFAGRLNDNGLYIDCNDEGVDILEARIGCKLHDFLKNPNPNSLQSVFPSGLLRNNSRNDSLVVVQVSFFDCGGMAVGVCLVHKIADGCTISTFLSAWASMARQSEKVLSPHFITSCLSSPPSETFNVQQTEDAGASTCITRRFVFNASKIANLKAMASSDSRVNSTTRVVTVIALLHKCAMAASREKSGSSRPSLLIQTVNMRPKMVPSLPENSVGNFSWHYTISVTNNAEFQRLVGQVREGMTKFNEYVKNYTTNEWFSVVRESLKEAKELYDSNMEIDIYVCSSMCRFPFYEVDFGWGKPIWAAVAGNVHKNTFSLMDTRSGDGIEAWVTLDEQEMALFECNEELLAFASLNPSVLDIN